MVTLPIPIPPFLQPLPDETLAVSLTSDLLPIRLQDSLFKAYKKRLDKLPSTGGPSGDAKAPTGEDPDPTMYGRAPKPEPEALNRLVDELAQREEGESDLRGVRTR